VFIVCLLFFFGGRDPASAIDKRSWEVASDRHGHIFSVILKHLHCTGSVEAIVAISSADTVTNQPCSIFLALHCAA